MFCELDTSQRTFRPPHTLGIRECCWLAVMRSTSQWSYESLKALYTIVARTTTSSLFASTKMNLPRKVTKSDWTQKLTCLNTLNGRLLHQSMRIVSFEFYLLSAWSIFLSCVYGKMLFKMLLFSTWVSNPFLALPTPLACVLRRQSNRQTYQTLVSLLLLTLPLESNGLFVRV